MPGVHFNITPEKKSQLTCGVFCSGQVINSCLQRKHRPSIA